MKSIYHLIIAGGSGSRFWPKSRKKKPKQLLNLLGTESMIRLTYNRLEKISSKENIFIIASESLCKKIHKEIPKIPIKNMIIEPKGKNTAPAIGLAASHIHQKDPNAIMGVFPADHLIEDDKNFKATIDKAIKLILNESALVTIGKKPTYPSTGYGYINFDSKGTNDEDEYRVNNFTEKPDLKTATKFLNTGNYFWNTGIFFWKTKSILSAIKSYVPELHQSLNIIYKNIGSSNYNHILTKQWNLLNSISIDYAILEKSNNLYMVKAEFKWSDLGTWKSLFNSLKKNKENNHYQGDVISLNSKGNLVISPDRLTAVIGIQNMAIINLNDVTLIVPHEESESIKDIVNMLESLNRNEYL
tara:strand:+ start:475 stop:1548 length:1074 start_codon:yes stop_codon:yes gene_type:complete